MVSAAEMLSVAAFLEGKHAQAVPSFGSERMGAPVVAFCRIDDKEIRLREPVLEPNALIVQDPTLFQAIDVFNGLPDDGYLLINTGRDIAELGIEKAVARLPEGHVCTVPAPMRYFWELYQRSRVSLRLNPWRRPLNPSFLEKSERPTSQLPGQPINPRRPNPD